MQFANYTKCLQNEKYILESTHERSIILIKGFTDNLSLENIKMTKNQRTTSNKFVINFFSFMSSKPILSCHN